MTQRYVRADGMDIDHFQKLTPACRNLVMVVHQMNVNFLGIFDMKRMIAVLAVGLTSACMSGESGPTTGITVTDSNFTQSSLVGRASGGEGVSMRFGTVSEATGTVRIDSALAATMVVDGETTALLAGSDGRFEGPLGQTGLIGTRLTGGPITRDVLYVFTVDLPPPALAGARLGIFVDGFETATANLPTGSATYNGTAFAINAAEQGATGSITLEADFAANSFDATLSGINASNPAASYAVVDGSEAAGQLSGDITGADATGGVLTGAIYGANGDQAAGTFRLTTGTTALVGTFGAVD